MANSFSVHILPLYGIWMNAYSMLATNTDFGIDEIPSSVVSCESIEMAKVWGDRWTHEYATPNAAVNGYTIVNLNTGEAVDRG